MTEQITVEWYTAVPVAPLWWQGFDIPCIVRRADDVSIVIDVTILAGRGPIGVTVRAAGLRSWQRLMRTVLFLDVNFLCEKGWAESSYFWLLLLTVMSSESVWYT